MRISLVVALAMACADVLALPMTGDVNRGPDLAVGGLQFPDDSFFVEGTDLGSEAVDLLDFLTVEPDAQFTSQPTNKEMGAPQAQYPSIDEEFDNLDPAVIDDLMVYFAGPPGQFDDRLPAETPATGVQSAATIEGLTKNTASPHDQNPQVFSARLLLRGMCIRSPF